MSDWQPEDDDVDERIGELFETHKELDERCFQRSSTRVAGEICRLARSHQQLIPYLNARFLVMNAARAMLDPESGRDAALELIALLQSEERARRLQPDFPEDEYEATVAWMSACAYDNLAECTAMMHGYNSEGMHSCIGDGIQVCRRTGKTQCITCFREYAALVHESADDLDMALHFARLLSTLPVDDPSRDRRTVGSRNEARFLLLTSQLDAAEAAARRSLELAETYHSPVAARLESLELLETVQLLAGRTGRPAQEANGSAAARELPAGESPDHDLAWDLRDALAASCRGDFDQAIEILKRWDRQLTERHCLAEWFEVRLRLLAAHRLAGRDDRIKALAQQLEARARKACDWLTLRRLARLLDPEESVSPLALLTPLSEGPFAAPAATEAVPAKAPDEAAPAEAVPVEPQAGTTPLEETYDRFWARLDEVEDDPDGKKTLREELLASPPTSATTAIDAARLIHLAIQLIDGDGRKLWNWARDVAANFPRDADVLVLLAVLGDLLLGEEDNDLEEQIDAQVLEGFFRRALDLDPASSRNFARAGTFYLGREDLGEAERCLARAFRLDRTFAYAALRLAELYDRTERPRDALAVLDLCLREGSDDPDVAWQAALSALSLEQHDSLLLYLDRYEALHPGQPWVHYYRALGLLDSGHPEAALEAVAEEERRNPEAAFAQEVVRACAASALGQVDRFREHLEEVLAIPLVSVDYLTIAGLIRLAERLWKAAGCLPEDDALAGALEERLLASGLAPDEFFTPHRERGETAEEINLYSCRVLQPLDDDWSTSEGCLAGQESWDYYRIYWGVLADDEEEAAQFVLEWQARCYHLPAEVEEVELLDDGYTDKPGVISQGERSCESAAEADDESGDLRTAP